MTGTMVRCTFNLQPEIISNIHRPVLRVNDEVPALNHLETVHPGTGSSKSGNSANSCTGM